MKTTIRILTNGAREAFVSKEGVWVPVTIHGSLRKEVDKCLSKMTDEQLEDVVTIEVENEKHGRNYSCSVVTAEAKDD